MGPSVGRAMGRYATRSRDEWCSGWGGLLVSKVRTLAKDGVPATGKGEVDEGARGANENVDKV